MSGPDTLPMGQRPGIWTLLGILLWFFAMLSVGSRGLLRVWQGIGPLSPLQVAIVGPMVLFWLAYQTIGPFRRYILGLDLTFLVAFQAMRILGCSHLVSWGCGLMAGGFALPVGLGNLAVALLALYTVFAVVHRTPRWRSWVMTLTVLGLLEFALTVALAILGFFTQVTPLDPPMSADGYMSFLRPPLSIFPTFLIPLFSLVHFATLVVLRRQPEQI